MSPTSTLRADTHSPDPTDQAASNVVELTGLHAVMAALVDAHTNKKRADAEARRANRIYDELAAIVKMHMGSAEIGTLDGVPVVSHVQSERIILRDKRVRELYPAEALECEDIIPVLTFRLLGR